MSRSTMGDVVEDNGETSLSGLFCHSSNDEGEMEILSPGDMVTSQGWPQYGYKALKYSSDNIR